MSAGRPDQSTSWLRTSELIKPVSESHFNFTGYIGALAYPKARVGQDPPFRALLEIAADQTSLLKYLPRFGYPPEDLSPRWPELLPTWMVCPDSAISPATFLGLTDARELENSWIRKAAARSMSGAVMYSSGDMVASCSVRTPG